MKTELEGALAALDGPGTFATMARIPLNELTVSVGSTALSLPMTNSTRKKLVKAAHRARYGKGTQTLLDTSVRDTWEIGASDLRLSGRAVIDAQLRRICDRLGLAETCTLEARLHNLLVYEPGQFFAPHQDSEKHDEMIGTLLVILPAVESVGGELVVSHAGASKTFEGAPRSLTLVAFFADCRHEVKPLRAGSRAVLTFNLIARGDTGSRRPLAERQASALRRAVDAHFKTPRDRWGTTEPPPDRLVYLLDHEYTERGLTWTRLKNGDAVRAAALRSVAAELGLEVTLAQADVHETWQCESDYGGWRGRSRASRGALVELIDSAVTLLRLVREDGAIESVQSKVERAELVQAGDGNALTPYRSEYEGYQGNYGDTEDRWYHRGALLLSPRARAFAIRARASPRWAMRQVLTAQRKGDAGSAHRLVSELLPNWSRSLPDEGRAPLLKQALSIAAGTADPSLATQLLAPFRLESLDVGAAPALAELLASFGPSATTLCAHWLKAEHYGHEHASWLPRLPGVLRRLPAADELVRALVRAQLDWLATAVAGSRMLPRYYARELARLRPAAVATIECAAVGGEQLRGAVRELFEPTADVAQVQWYAEVLLGLRNRLSAAERDTIALEPLVQGVARALRSELERPVRAADDWSIGFPDSCTCELCATLRRFLSDRAETVLEWPLAEQRRRHIHGVIDSHGLPVTHETRRTGRPLTLVLRKQRALFDQAKQRALRQRPGPTRGVRVHDFGTGAGSGFSGNLNPRYVALLMPISKSSDSGNSGIDITCATERRKTAPSSTVHTTTCTRWKLSPFPSSQMSFRKCRRSRSVSISVMRAASSFVRSASAFASSAASSARCAFAPFPLRPVPMSSELRPVAPLMPRSPSVWVGMRSSVPVMMNTAMTLTKTMTPQKAIWLFPSE
jgi:hypothetical protein